MKLLLALEGKMSNDKNAPFLTEDCFGTDLSVSRACCKLRVPTSETDVLIKPCLVSGCADLEK
jgi:hypothetical protein